MREPVASLRHRGAFVPERVTRHPWRGCMAAILGALPLEVCTSAVPLRKVSGGIRDGRQERSRSLWVSYQYGVHAPERGRVLIILEAEVATWKRSRLTHGESNKVSHLVFRFPEE